MADTDKEKKISEQVEQIELIEDAKHASQEEHETTFWQALKSNRKAAMWSAIISLTIIMEGYDIGLIYQFFAYPSFAETFGKWDESTQSYQVSGPWQAGLSNGANCGVVIGGFLNGYLSARFGYKKVILGALFFMNWFIFFPFFAKSAEVLLVGQILCGLTWGVFATTGPAYASEVCPLALRGYLTCYVNLCWCIGQLIAAGILYGLLDLHGTWSYRIAYALQWAWPIPLFLLILFGPESPWYLVRNDRIDDAMHALSKLNNKGEESNRQTVAQIMHTLKIENQIESGASYFDCFRGIDLRRTEIVCMTFAGQVLSGSTFAYGPTYFFQQAGIPTHSSYGIAVGGTGVAFCGTVISWFLLSRFGRRTLYLSGMICDCLLLLIVGILASASTTSGSKWGQAALCLIWLFVYSSTVGPICYTIISETSSLRLRAKSVCLSRNIYNITQIIANVIEPYLINPTEANLKGKTAYFWFGTAFLACIWTYFRLPECRGRTYEELDVMFAQKVPARKFATWQVDAYDNEIIDESKVARK
ncbi:Maltose permease MAL31 [Pseudocercospora fuligena]|uniref:Maltose permease MAL31 n=1 Tax=Pseudocercospora fuligena TaxID=685502 RepID=A0A8H6RX77_9PEZI|nr:Maltose permease MAL31 [Pseudocercospora fuligena]